MNEIVYFKIMILFRCSFQEVELILLYIIFFHEI